MAKRTRVGDGRKAVRSKPAGAAIPETASRAGAIVRSSPVERIVDAELMDDDPADAGGGSGDRDLVEAKVVGFWEDIFNDVARYAVKRTMIKIRRLG